MQSAGLEGPRGKDLKLPGREELGEGQGRWVDTFSGKEWWGNECYPPRTDFSVGEPVAGTTSL